MGKFDLCNSQSLGLGQLTELGAGEGREKERMEERKRECKYIDCLFTELLLSFISVTRD